MEQKKVVEKLTVDTAIRLIIKTIIGILLTLFTLDGFIYILALFNYWEKPRLFFITFSEFMFLLHGNRSHQISHDVIVLLIFIAISIIYDRYLITSWKKQFAK